MPSWERGSGGLVGCLRGSGGCDLVRLVRVGNVSWLFDEKSDGC